MSADEKYKGGVEPQEFTHNKIILGGEVYVSDYRSEMMLFDLIDKNKYSLSENELNFILKDLFHTDDVDEFLTHLKNNFNIKTIVSIFKIDEMLNTQINKYKLLEEKIKEYFIKQKNKYIKDLKKPEKIEGACDYMINDHLQELTELDIKCVDSIITQYIIDITNIKTEDELKIMSTKLMDMINDTEYLNKFKYRKSLKIKIQKLHEKLTNILSNKEIVEKINNKITAVFPSEKSQILQFLINSVESLMVELKQMEKIYDECAVIISEIIDTWNIIIGSDTTPCILHTSNVMKLYVGSRLLGLVADKKFNNNSLSLDMKSIFERTEKNILGTIDLLDIYTNKFEWDNISQNISNLLRL